MKDFITSKKQIKDGMTFSCNGKLYLKIGKLCAEVIAPATKPFADFPEDEIKMIFNRKGLALIKDEPEE